MKTSMLISSFVACALSAPIVSAQDKSAPASPAMSMGMDKQMPQMQENMKKMQAQMDKIHKTTDPKERQILMQEHTQAMQENMKAMRGMGGPMMMEQHMDMMQMMMEQMVQHGQMMQSMPAK